MFMKDELEELSRSFDTSEDFDSVMAYYDIAEISPNLRGRTILEMGTSAGTVTKYLYPFADKLDIVEGSATGIKRSKELLGDCQGKITYHHALWQDYTPDKTYSDIVFVRGLEHVKNSVGLLVRMKGWSADGGRIHIIVPNALSLHRRVMVADGTLPDLYAMRERDAQVGHVRIYDEDNLVRDVESAGLSVHLVKGFYLKQIGTSEMTDITMDKDHPLACACYEAGKLLPELGTQLYLIAE